MKKLLIAISASLITSCISTTKITGSWVSAKSARSYSNVFVAAFIGNAVVKSTVENRVAECLNKNGIKTLKSMDAFPPTFLNDTIDRKVMLNLVSQMEAESILVITIIKEESDYRYIPGPRIYRPDLYPHTDYLGDYYEYWYPCVYDRTYYLPNEIYYIETNLYDVLSQELVWSAQSQTYNPVNLTIFARDYAIKMVERMKADRVLKTVSASVTKNNNV